MKKYRVPPGTKLNRSWCQKNKKRAHGKMNGVASRWLEFYARSTNPPQVVTYVVMFHHITSPGRKIWDISGNSSDFLTRRTFELAVYRRRRQIPTLDVQWQSMLFYDRTIVWIPWFAVITLIWDLYGRIAKAFVRHQRA